MTTGHDAVVGCFVCAVIATVFVGLRIYTRLFISRHPGWDDNMVVLALLFAIALCPIYVQQLRYGLGDHVYEIPPAKLSKQMQWFWVSTWIYLTGVAFAKISILIQYIRVFVGTKTIIASWATVGFIVTCCLVCFFGGIFACSPVEKFWNPTIPGTCINYLAIWYLHCSMAIATDLAIVIIPLPTIVNMNLENKKKWSLAFTFALGGFGCVTSIIRLYYLRFLTTTSDPTHYNPIPALWSAVELAVVIVCACLITLHPLLVRVLRPLRRFASQYHSGAGGGGGATEEERARRRRERLPSYVQDGAGVSEEERRERYSRAVVAGWEGGKSARGRGANVVVGLGTMLLESGWSEERLAPEGMAEGEIKVQTTVDVASTSLSTTNTDAYADADAGSVLTRERSEGEEGKWVDVEIGKGGV
ncbi:hypothetical protein SLS58_007109 [Diplodia intermedia]|uniref:Rhodopsin domain-containing protein n=1 Tax=Diplodia intermedia TaxID=856260 RepID=A0ABR3TL43_9PEZI